MVDLTEEEFQLARAEISKNLADPYRAFTTESLITRYAAYLQSKLDALASPATNGDGWNRDMSKAPEGKAVELWVPGNKCIYMAVYRKKEGWSIFGGDWREHIQRGTAWREPAAPPTEAGHE